MLLNIKYEWENLKQIQGDLQMRCNKCYPKPKYNMLVRIFMQVGICRMVHTGGYYRWVNAGGSKYLKVVDSRWIEKKIQIISAIQSFGELRMYL